MTEAERDLLTRLAYKMSDDLGVNTALRQMLRERSFGASVTAEDDGCRHLRCLQVHGVCQVCRAERAEERERAFSESHSRLVIELDTARHQLGEAERVAHNLDDRLTGANEKLARYRGLSYNPDAIRATVEEDTLRRDGTCRDDVPRMLRAALAVAEDGR